MDKSTFLKFLDSTKALGHLLIASLALLSSKSLGIQLLFDNGSTKTVQAKTSDLLRQMQYFQIDAPDYSARYAFPLEPAATLMELNNPDREKSIKLLFNTALQIPIVRVFELIRSYCKNTSQTTKFKEQKWHFTAWIIRNCFSHDFNLEIYTKELRRKLPYTWEEITITEEMLGKPLKFTDASIRSLTRLFDTMTNFGTQLD